MCIDSHQGFCVVDGEGNVVSEVFSKSPPYKLIPVDIKAAKLLTGIDDLRLPTRTKNCLKRLGILNLTMLVDCTEDYLLDSKNFGQTALLHVKQCLSGFGLVLRKSENPISRELLAASITRIKLTDQVTKTLRRCGITTIKDLTAKTADDLRRYRLFGRNAMREIRTKLANAGASLSGEKT